MKKLPKPVATRAAKSLPAQSLPAPTQQCQFAFADGRRCRMPRSETHRSLCISHARQEQQLLSVDCVGRELVSLSGDFKTSSDINHVLGKLFSLLANNRIPPRNAAALAYIAQLLLQTLPAVEIEIKNGAGDDEWEATVRAALGDPQQAGSDHDDDDQGDDDDDDDEGDDDDDADADQGRDHDEGSV